LISRWRAVGSQWGGRGKVLGSRVFLAAVLLADEDILRVRRIFLMELLLLMMLLFGKGRDLVRLGGADAGLWGVATLEESETWERIGLMAIMQMSKRT
jgi:hypothetical protein